MAKSRKSKKASDAVEQSGEADKNVTKTAAMPQDLDASLPDAGQTNDAAEGAEPELSLEEALEATDKEVFESDAPESAAPADADQATEDASDVTEAKTDTAQAEPSDMSYEEALEATDADIFDAKAEPDATAEASPEEAAPTEEAPAPEAKAEPEPKPAAAPTPPPQQSSGGMWPAVFGGIVAALLGFIAGRGDQLDQYLPASMQRSTVDLTALEAEAAELSERTAAQQARIDALEAAAAAAPEVVETPAVEAEDYSDEIASLEDTIATLTERLAAVESRPVVDIDAAPSEAVASLQAAFDAQNAQIADLAKRAADAEAQAAGEAARILARAALTRVVTAVDSGQSFAPALSDLEAVAPVEVPEPLRAAADAGVPTLAALQDSFPDAARAGLAAARSGVPKSEVDGLSGFLKRQLNVRSVIPREGDDPDAVLSRVQVAVRGGDLETALDEIASLPDSAKSAMSEWVQAAEARKAAQDAANDLADSLNSN